MAKKFYQLGANDDVALEEDVSAKYTKPETGIPKDDLSEDVKTSIGSANSAMQHSEFSALSGIADLVPDEVGLPQICSLMNTIKNLLKPTTACIAFLASLLTINAADFQTAKYSALVGKDEVVTNLSFSGLATESYVVTKISEATGDYQNVSNKAYSALQPTDVVNNVTSDAADKPLSANMGKELQDQISNLKQRGRYLSVWNCTNGLPTTSPTVSPYVYKAGDYYIVGFVSTATNYRPSGVSYTQGVPSTTVETQTVLVNDTYYFDGTVWTLLQAAQKEISFGSLAGSPYDNTNLKDALDSGFAYTTAVSNKLENGKQDTISDLATIRAGAAKGDTAVQPAAISDMATKTWVGQQGYETTVHASQTYQTKISDYTTTNAVISISSTQITNSVLNGYLAQPSVTNAINTAKRDKTDLVVYTNTISLASKHLPITAYGSTIEVEIDADQTGYTVGRGARQPSGGFEINYFKTNPNGIITWCRDEVTAGGVPLSEGMKIDFVNSIVATTDYLCTVSAAQGMTNGVMTAANGKFLAKQYSAFEGGIPGTIGWSNTDGYNYLSVSPMEYEVVRFTSAGVYLKSSNWNLLYRNGGEGEANTVTLKEEFDSRDTTIGSMQSSIGFLQSDKANVDDVYTKTQINGNAVTNLGAVAAATNAANSYADENFVPLEIDYITNKTAVTIGSRYAYVGQYSFVNGYYCEATGYYSHAEGYETYAEGDYSHAEGDETSAEGDYSHAEGEYTVASGRYSHSEGWTTESHGEDSHAEGSHTYTEGLCSHAEGAYTFAYGMISHVSGWGAVASNRSSFVWQGMPVSKAWNDSPSQSELYCDHGEGTYNINPIGGLSGFWIGNTSASNHISNIAERSAIAVVSPVSNSVVGITSTVATHSSQIATHSSQIENLSETKRSVTDLGIYSNVWNFSKFKAVNKDLTYRFDKPEGYETYENYVVGVASGPSPFYAVIAGLNEVSDLHTGKIYWKVAEVLRSGYESTLHTDIREDGIGLVSGSLAKISDIPSTNGLITAATATNIANAVVSPTSNVVFNTETYFALNDGDLELVSESNLVFQGVYELTNYSNAASISLYHGQIASQNLTSQNALNITLKYPTGAQKAGDAMLRVVSTLAATATVVSVEGATSFHFAGAKDWNVFDAGSTNLLSFTKVAMENGDWEIWVGKAKSEL